MRKRNLGPGGVAPWYPVELPLTYDDPKQGSLRGDGRTLAISSDAIRFACDRDLPIGRVIRLAVRWPAKLRDGASLNFSAIATIQRSGFGEVEAVLIRHEFRVRWTERAVIICNATVRAAG